jgi:carbonic anhydrase
MHSFPQHLLDGYAAFMGGPYASASDRYRTLARDGQAPTTMVIACCDSRAAPETIFDAGPGELFVLRNVANLVPTFQPDGFQHGTSAGIEFAVNALEVQNLVVLGHGRCGGIRAFADDSQGPLSPGDFIGKWITLIGPAAQRTGGRGRNESFEDYVERLCLTSIQQSLTNLRTFPCIQILEGKGRLQLHGAYFAVATGVLMLLDPVSGQFVPAVGEMPKKVQMIRCDEPG